MAKKQSTLKPKLPTDEQVQEIMHAQLDRVQLRSWNLEQLQTLLTEYQETYQSYGACSDEEKDAFDSNYVDCRIAEEVAALKTLYAAYVDRLVAFTKITRSKIFPYKGMTEDVLKEVSKIKDQQEYLSSFHGNMGLSQMRGKLEDLATGDHIQRYVEYVTSRMRSCDRAHFWVDLSHSINLLNWELERRAEAAKNEKRTKLLKQLNLTPEQKDVLGIAD